MKVSKDARRTARQLFALATRDGALNDDTVRKILVKMREDKPRNYAGVLVAFSRLVKLEKERNHATVESAVELTPALREEITSGLKKKFGDQLTFEYNVNPELLGGVRAKVGSNVWDGSVKARLANLADSLGA